jgi:hypothetical protein
MLHEVAFLCMEMQQATIVPLSHSSGYGLVSPRRGAMLGRRHAPISLMLPYHKTSG